MRFKEILLEYDRARTQAEYGKAIANIAVGVDQPEQYGGVREETVKKLSGGVLDALEQADPTKKKAFVRHLLKWYLDGSLRNPEEDAPKATQAITLYLKFKNKVKTDLSKMTFGEFLDLGDSLINTKSQTEAADDIEQALFSTQQAELLYDDDDIKAIIPKTEAAARWFGKGTRWCTSADENNFFDRYNGEGPLYIFIFKGTPHKWQIHLETSSFMDERDEELTCREVRAQPIVQKVIPWENIQGKVNDDWHYYEVRNVVRFMAGVTKSQQLMMVKTDPITVFNTMVNPCREAYIEAVTRQASLWERMPENLKTKEVVQIIYDKNMFIALHAPQLVSDEELARCFRNSTTAYHMMAVIPYLRNNLGPKAMLAALKLNDMRDTIRLLNREGVNIPDGVLEELLKTSAHSVVRLFPYRTEVLWKALEYDPTVIYEFENPDEDWMEAGRELIVRRDIDTSKANYEDAGADLRAITDGYLTHRFR